MYGNIIFYLSSNNAEVDLTL